MKEKKHLIEAFNNHQEIEWTEEKYIKDDELTDGEVTDADGEFRFYSSTIELKSQV